MAQDGSKELIDPNIMIAIVVGAFTLVVAYIYYAVKKGLFGDVEPHVKNEPQQDTKKKDSSGTAKSKKKTSDTRWSSKPEKKSFTHPWLLTSLKGHSGQILDMEFSSNGKYLASCADDLDPGGEAGNSSSSSGSECNKENSRPSSTDSSSPITKGLSRRQRKNRVRREDVSPPETKKKTVKPKPQKKSLYCVPLRQYTRLNLTENQLWVFLQNYLLNPQQMWTLAYPVESDTYPGKAVIYRSSAMMPHRGTNKASKFDVNAREFIPEVLKPRHESMSGDSGQGSGNSSDCGESEESSNSLEVLSYNLSKKKVSVTVERKCIRCGRGFFVDSNGEYLTHERCCYHWGKLQRSVTQTDKYSPYSFRTEYSCCHQKENAVGCEEAKLHVWSGVGTGFNGPYDSYVKTRPRKSPPSDGNYGIYALDCEMCYTVHGLELTKITVVGSDGRLVYDCFVKPESDIVDYNTRFSGITSKDLGRKGAVKSLKDVQNDLMGFISADTILIGHGLENDLRALRIMHGTVVDTAVAFPHYNGLPYRRSLKSLVSTYLKREIQCGSNGHDSFEDARSCMELILWKVRKDFRNVLEHCH